jgi:hypothetical protein
MTPALKALFDEIHGSDRPESLAMLVIGMMSGEIVKATGSEEFMHLMRMVVRSHENRKPGYQPVHTIIDQMIEQMKAQYLKEQTGERHEQ